MKNILVIVFGVFIFLFTFGFTEVKNSEDVLNISFQNEKDMVLIPAGFFEMGSIYGFENEYPVKKIWLDSFYIDKYPVTNAQYKKFCDAKKLTYPQNPSWDTSYFLRRPNYPVINVKWDSALAYAKWANKRLPSEAEWEKAARGGENSKYFTGDTITHNDANFNGTAGADVFRYTSPVGFFPPNKYGLYDMYGNVWQWCNDFYLGEYYYIISETNPTGPISGTERIIRGGSWDSSPQYLRTTVRGKNLPIAKNSNVGFRCAMSVKK